MGDLRLGQKLINHFRFGPNKIDNEYIWQRIITMEDDEFQRILDVTIHAPPSSDLRIAQYQKLLNVSQYDQLKKLFNIEDEVEFVMPKVLGYPKKKKKKKK